MSTMRNGTGNEGISLFPVRSETRSYGETAEGPAAVVEFRLDDLAAGPTPRELDLHEDHVRALAEAEGRWPPILVSRGDHRIIDGHHRVAAARSLGHTTIAATWFTGTPEDAYVEAVRRNVKHGLPLTLSERKGAAGQILDANWDWSDRRVAELCALSPRTIARIRADRQPPLAPASRPCATNRVGRDGKRRPTDPEALRQTIVAAVIAHPGASLRAIAGEAGASPETVRRVRARLDLHTLSVPAPPRRPPAPPAPWVADSALASTDQGQAFTQWFNERELTDDDLTRFVGAVPLSRIYQIADEARRRAAGWRHFADALESRAQPASAQP